MTRSHLHLLAKPGARDELRRELDRLEVLLTLREEPGLLGLEVLVSEDDTDRVLLETSWSSEAHYERWHSSEPSKALSDELDGLLAAPPEIQVYRVVDAAA
jgi:quinol monooxygenase YgiN